MQALSEQYRNRSMNVEVYFSHKQSKRLHNFETKEMDKSNIVFSIAVRYSGANTESWAFKLGFEISSPIQILTKDN